LDILFQTQRINHDKNYSLLNEQIFLTIQQDGKVVGSVTAIITYPDQGTGNTSSPGRTDYPVCTSSGNLTMIKTIRINFNPDLTRNVYLIS